MQKAVNTPNIILTRPIILHPCSRHCPFHVEFLRQLQTLKVNGSFFLAPTSWMSCMHHKTVSYRTVIVFTHVQKNASADTEMYIYVHNSLAETYDNRQEISSHADAIGRKHSWVYQYNNSSHRPEIQFTDFTNQGSKFPQPTIFCTEEMAQIMKLWHQTIFQ